MIMKRFKEMNVVNINVVLEKEVWRDSGNTIENKMAARTIKSIR
jgi:hypothetical protein